MNRLKKLAGLITEHHGKQVASSGQLEVNGISYIFDELVQQLKIMDERISKLERR